MEKKTHLTYRRIWSFVFLLLLILNSTQKKIMLLPLPLLLLLSDSENHVTFLFVGVWNGQLNEKWTNVNAYTYRTVHMQMGERERSLLVSLLSCNTYNIVNIHAVCTHSVQCTYSEEGGRAAIRIYSFKQNWYKSKVKSTSTTNQPNCSTTNRHFYLCHLNSFRKLIDVNG